MIHKVSNLMEQVWHFWVALAKFTGKLRKTVVFLNCLIYKNIWNEFFERVVDKMKFVRAFLCETKFFFQATWIPIKRGSVKKYSKAKILQFCLSSFELFWTQKSPSPQTGADLGFSRGGADLGFSWADLGFSRGGRIFKRICFFISRQNWFSELSQSSKKTLFWPKFLRRRQIFENRPKKAFSGTFSKILRKKSRFFGARSPLKISIYWRQKRL